MFCPNCGKKIPKNTNFCPFCGSKITVNVNASYKDTNNNYNKYNNQTSNETNVIYCSSCGKKIPKNANVCPFCGHIINIHINSKTKEKLQPKQSTYKPNYYQSNYYNEYNTKRISKKAKLMFAGLIGVILFGGIYHHIHKNSPANIQLQQQIPNHVYKVSGASDMFGSNSDSDLSNKDIKDLFNSGRDLSNSDEKMSFKGGIIRPYSDNSDSDTPSDDSIDYQAKGDTLKISDGNKIGGGNSDSDQGTTGSDTGNYVKFQVIKVLNHGKTLILYPKTYSAKSDDDGSVQHVSSSRQKKNKLTLKRIR